MKVSIALMVLAVAAVAVAKPDKKKQEKVREDKTSVSDTCSGNGRDVTQFAGRKEATLMPCKYHAVRQQCGKYMVTLTPGNVYLHPKYRLDSLWLGLRETGKGGKRWEGRTDNKIAVKYFNGWKGDLFNKKDGNLGTEDVLRFGRDCSKTWVEAKNGDFKVTFVPWDPENKDFPMSQWSFECRAKGFTPSGYPQQVCGGEDDQEVAARTKELGLESREQTIFYDVFTNKAIRQMNPKCVNATRIMTEECNDKQKREAMITCTQILASYKHTKCVTKYSCDPMDTFLDCVDWVCSGYKNDDACERVGRTIDLCRKFKAGGLSEKVDKAKCFKDFLPIEN
ncbi:uncharacterized protein LOC143294642 [Babylonia areolata]|uniref:uncharacterized protein LOC143294642 n=1 Tax=Babylonia areolata TaxID=304850 RepID=UPI003FD4EA1D